ncbi:hypothetical protein D6C81_10711 [Aureobasidium pullulans]|nr:hypothetical protein D6C81_10711 [Aureobasidium pullulans]
MLALTRGASKEDSLNKAIRICELRGGTYYRAFILEELEVSTAIVNSILRSAELSNIEGILEANFGMGCCVILSQIGDSNLLRLSRLVIGSTRTSVVSPYTLGFKRSTS